jgi:hypothetical protein
MPKNEEKDPFSNPCLSGKNFHSIMAGNDLEHKT